MSIDYRDRFAVSHDPFDKEALHRHPVMTAGLKRLAQRFKWSLQHRGVVVCTGVSGSGKTAGVAGELRQLPAHRYRIIYLEDSSAGANDIFRTLAYELDFEPAFRRAKLWRDLKSRLLKLDQDNDQQVIIVIDDAHRLSSDFLNSLGAFMNFAFDSKEVLTVWLIGDRTLLGKLQMACHQHLLTRVRMHVHVDPLDHEAFRDWAVTCIKNAGCQRQLLTTTAMDAAFQFSRGVPRTAAKLLSLSLRLAHERDSDIIDEAVIEAATKELLL